ncbi:MAG: hypothetical protein ABR537_00835 [Gemmatimonadales bacterium]
MMHVHRALLEAERIRYERQHGRVASSGALLQLVLNDPWFYWLRPISSLIAQLDEWLDTDPPPADAATLAEILLAQVRDRLRPDENGADFQQRYHRLLQEEPTVAVAHAEVRKLINA